MSAAGQVACIDWGDISGANQPPGGSAAERSAQSGTLAVYDQAGCLVSPEPG